MENPLLDSPVGRAHSCAAGAPGSRGSQEALTTKIHAATDVPGMPLRFVLTGGHRHDPAQAMAPAEGFRYERLTEDKAYDLSGFAEHITASGAGPVIPPRSDRLTQREYDHHICEKRHLIECLLTSQNSSGVFSHGLTSWQNVI